MKKNLEIIERVRRHPLLVSVDDFETFVRFENESSITYRDGSAIRENQSSGLNISLRVLHRKQPGFSSVRSEMEIDAMVESAIGSARKSSVDPWSRFPLMHAGEHAFNFPDKEGEEIESVYPLLAQKPHVFEEQYSRYYSEFALYRNSEKRSLSYSNFSQTARMEAIEKAQNCFVKVTDEVEGRDLGSDREKRASKFADRLAAHRSSVPWTFGRKTAAILGSRALCQILDRMGSWFCADQVQLMKSPLFNSDLAASSKINLVDDGTFTDSRYSAPFDCEGVRCDRSELIRMGRTVGYLFDSGTGARANRPSTGNRFVRGDESSPRVRPVHLKILPGEQVKRQLLGHLGDGVFIEAWDSLYPKSQTELALVGSGWKIVKGQPEYPVSGLKMTINPMTFFEGAEELGRDSEVHERCSAPSILFRPLPLDH